ncbi:MAG: rRNA maturation RNase YbeY [Nitrospirae bacterium]|nr:MAG: rRNA maturation RNase YbeY [Nitrospirota bacterium]
MKIEIQNRQRKIKTDRAEIIRFLDRLGKLLGLQRGELSIVFANDSFSRRLNREYRGKDTPTDVLSFPMYESISDLPQEGEFLLGDIVINLHQAQRQAKNSGRPLFEELKVLLVHGLLHLLGYDHERNEKEERKMRREETRLLNALEKMD